LLGLKVSDAMLAAARPCRPARTATSLGSAIAAFAETAQRETEHVDPCEAECLAKAAALAAISSTEVGTSPDVLESGIVGQDDFSILGCCPVMGPKIHRAVEVHVEDQRHGLAHAVAEFCPKRR
jgi:hypothetical protein